MTRVFSALALLPIVLGVIWLMPPLATLALGEVVLVLAFLEYARLTDRLGARIPTTLTGLAAAVTCAAFGWPGATPMLVLMTATIAICAAAVGAGRVGEHALRDVGAAVFALLYLALPIGALVAVRTFAGRQALLALILTVTASDVAQYYAGRLFGRRLLAPMLSPRKTVEGASGGFLAGVLTMIAVGRWGLAGVPIATLLVLGATIVALGLAGDLFESLLKRSAGVKDTSGLIPGHGGVLDRIDSLLFAAPAYYVFVQFWH
ncbi:MAG: phosphatidate cytidylyltransferase [Acidobacteria bacterium]|nr:phosphatidate cytidylyltransferase [Acidobacteriota bacterium]